MNANLTSSTVEPPTRTPRRTLVDRVPDVLLDVRFWIILLFAIRLENIDLPPLDAHAWRQTLTLGVARNYLEWDANFFHPRTVICEDRSGIFPQEFPLYNYAVAGLWYVFGQQNWCFRLFSLIVGSIGLLAFSRVVRRLAGPRVSVAATVVFGVSVAFMYARKAMPDMFAISIALVAVDFAQRFFERGGRRDLWWFGIFAALGLLSKMPAACVLCLLIAPMLDGRVALRRKYQVLAAGAVGVALMGLWYFAWVPWIEKTHHFKLFYPVSLAEGWREIVEMQKQTIERFYPVALRSPLAFLAAVTGIGVLLWNRQRALLALTVGYSLVMFVFILKAGRVFSSHEYYVLPYVPMMALLAGVAIAEVAVLLRRWPRAAVASQLVLVGVIAYQGISVQKSDFFIPEADKRFTRLEAVTAAHVPPGVRVLTNRGAPLDPTMMYFTHRTGRNDAGRCQHPEWLGDDIRAGMGYAVFDRTVTVCDTFPFPMVYEDQDFRIFKLSLD